MVAVDPPSEKAAFYFSENILPVENFRYRKSGRRISPPETGNWARLNIQKDSFALFLPRREQRKRRWMETALATVVINHRVGYYRERMRKVMEQKDVPPLFHAWFPLGTQGQGNVHRHFSRAFSMLHEGMRYSQHVLVGRKCFLEKKIPQSHRQFQCTLPNLSSIHFSSISIER